MFCFFKDCIHISISTPSAPQPSCHAFLSDPPTGTFHCKDCHLTVSLIPGARGSSFSRPLGALPQHLPKYPAPCHPCHFPRFPADNQAGPYQVAKPQLFMTNMGLCPRYLFGLPPPKGSWMPGNACRGFLPCIFLAITTVLLLSSVNIYHAYGYCQNNSCE